MDHANLAMLIELARTARDAAAARRAQAQLQAGEAGAQLQTLRNYARDYERRAQTTLSGGCDLAAQDNLRAFNQKLALAVTTQQAEVARREQLLAASAQEFIELQRKLASLQALAARGAERARQESARREQKSMDEMASGTRARADRPLAANRW